MAATPFEKNGHRGHPTPFPSSATATAVLNHGHSRLSRRRNDRGKQRFRRHYRRPLPHLTGTPQAFSMETRVRMVRTLVPSSRTFTSATRNSAAGGGASSTDACS